MFGNNDDQQQPQGDNGAMQAAMPDPITNAPVTSSGAAFGAASTQQSAPTIPDFKMPELSAAGTPDLPNEQADSSTSPANLISPTAPAGQPGADDDLIGLKQQALQHLSPLVSHLDQTPEEKFRTTMMMIQASDDQTLIKSAFEAAQEIKDDKARAQALLDVINEINYFTQHQS